MNGRCPKCDAPINLEQAAKDEASRELLAEVTALGERGGLVLEYVQAFRAAPGASISPAKQLRLVRDLRALIESGRFLFDGAEYAVSLEIIDEALREVCNRSLIILRNHHYFYRVLLGLRSQTRPRRTRPASPSSGRPQAPVGAGPVREGGDIDMEEVRAFNERLAGIGKPMPAGEADDV